MAETHSKTSASVKPYALCRFLSPNNAVTSAISFLLYCVTSLLQRQFDTRDQITLIKTNELNNSRIMGARSRDVRLFPKKMEWSKRKRGPLIFSSNQGREYGPRLSRLSIDLRLF